MATNDAPDLMQALEDSIEAARAARRRPLNWMQCSSCGEGDAESHTLEPTFAGPQTVYTCATALCDACKLLPVEQLDIDRARGCRTCMVHLRLRKRREQIEGS